MARQLPNFNPLKNRRKSDAARRANQVIRSRTMLMMAVLGVGTFLALFGRLYHCRSTAMARCRTGRCISRP